MLFWLLSVAHAAPPPACTQIESGAAYVLTMAPGDRNENLFGHTALLLFPEGGEPMVYDWGHYTPGAIKDIVDFIRGEPTYYLGATGLNRKLKKRQRDKRSVYAQRLDLSPDALAKLSSNVDWMEAGERQPFAYHWLHTNCTTELLDRIDEAVGGALSAQHAEVGDRSAAGEALAHAAKKPLTWFAFHLGCGQTAHTPLSDWDARFMPQATYDLLEDTSLDGRPFVTQTCTLFDSDHDMLETQPPPNRDGWLALLGLLGAGAVGAAAWRRRTLGIAGAAVVGGVLGFWGFVIAFFAWFGTFAPVWTVHNLPVVSPLQWLLIPAAIGAWRTPAATWPSRLAWGLVALGGLGALIAAVRGFGDHNLGVVLWALPLSAVAAWALRPASVSR
ncbi:MAG: DUF4105 domain-containing protein [Myxococcales bacterium]|nr:DUF4105 domain-containing protein [Myxococcales bacterium]